MRLPKFEYFEPTTVDEACFLLSEYREQAKLLAGGTDLLVMLKQRSVIPQYIVNIKKISDLDYISEDNDVLKIGALATLSNIETSLTIKHKLPILSCAANSVATNQIKTMATIGGNLCLDSKCWYYNQSHIWKKSRDPCFKRGGDLCHFVKGGKRCYAVLSGDTIPALLVLGAKVKIIRSGGQRTIPIEDFFTGIGEKPNILNPQEMVTEIQIPFPSPDASGSFIKHRIRGTLDFAIANAATVVTKEDKICKDARIAISSVGPAAVRVREAEEILKGKEINDEVLEEAGKAAVKGVPLVSGVYSSVYHRRKMIKVLTKRVVIEAMGVS